MKHIVLTISAIFLFTIASSQTTREEFRYLNKGWGLGEDGEGGEVLDRRIIYDSYLELVTFI